MPIFYWIYPIDTSRELVIVRTGSRSPGAAAGRRFAPPLPMSAPFTEREPGSPAATARGDLAARVWRGLSDGDGTHVSVARDVDENFEILDVDAINGIFDGTVGVAAIDVEDNLPFG